MSLDPRVDDLAKRVKDLEAWRDHICQALMYAPSKEVPKDQTKLESPFPNATVDMAKFSEQAKEWIVFEGNVAKAKGYIFDKGLWEALNNELKTHGYRWVSAGKDSRWEK